MRAFRSNQQMTNYEPASRMHKWQNLLNKVCQLCASTRANRQKPHMDGTQNQTSTKCKWLVNLLLFNETRNGEHHSWVSIVQWQKVRCLWYTEYRFYCRFFPVIPNTYVCDLLESRKFWNKSFVRVWWQNRCQYKRNTKNIDQSESMTATATIKPHVPINTDINSEDNPSQYREP